MFEVFEWMWGIISPLLFLTAWLIPTWITAYACKMTAPQVCPDGAAYQHCYSQHAPTHVVRNNTWVALAWGAAWPITWLLLLGKVFAKTVDTAVAVTPTPKPKPALDSAITSGSKTTDEFLDEMENQVDHEQKIIEPNRVIDPPDGEWID